MTDLEHQIMRLESRWWRLPGSKESAIRRDLGLSPTRYYQLLHQLIGRPDVHAEYPALVGRLRRHTKPRRTRRRGITLD